MSLNDCFANFVVREPVSSGRFQSVNERVIPLLRDIECLTSGANGKTTFRELDELEFQPWSLAK
jgi:hypothetical protein